MSGISRILLGASLYLASQLSIASCALAENCYDIGGQVKSCKAIVQDKQEFLRIAVKEIVVAHRMCDAPGAEQPWSEPPASNVAAIVKRDVAYYEIVKFYYLPSTPGLSCKALKRKRITATVDRPCCDTFPAWGACALRGAVIKLTALD